MAFNPFATFRKYQKFWIAGILFVCMVSFVLCTGLGQGGLEDRLLGWLYRLRNPGPVVAVVDGRNVYREELSKLEQQRGIANLFMKAATGVVIANVEDWVKRLETNLEKKDLKDEEKQEYTELKGGLKVIAMRLKAQMSRPQYFETTGHDETKKLDNLLDFMLWRQQADRLGVQLVEESVKENIEASLVSLINILSHNMTQAGFRGIPASEFWNPQSAAIAMSKVREEFHNVSYSQTLNALTDEFRVEIVQYCMLGTRMFGLTQAEFRKDVKEFGMQIRFPLSPYQMWKEYKQNLTKFDVVMLPVDVDQFVDQVEKPSTDDLERLFKKYKSKAYNPSSDTPGFIQPPKAKIQYVTADPESDYYRNLAEAVTILRHTPPAFFDAGMPGFTTPLRFALGEVALESRMKNNYDQLLVELREKMENRQIAALPFQLPPLTNPNVALPIYTSREPKAQMVASLVGSFSLPAGQLSMGGVSFPAAAPPLLSDGFAGYQAGYLAPEYFDDQEELQATAEKETNERIKFNVGLAMSGLISASPLAQLGNVGALMKAEEIPQFLPFATVKPIFSRRLKKNLARDWAKDVMVEVKRYLADAQGDSLEFKARLHSLRKEYQEGISVYSTDDWVTKWNVGKNEAMQPLKDEFLKQGGEVPGDYYYLAMINKIESRGGTENQLTDEHFYKLFFDSADTFSLASASPYVFEQWPPEVVAPHAVHLGGGFVDDNELGKGVPLNMWEMTDRRFLFWKTAAEVPPRPKKLADVRDIVEEAWKTQEARKLAWQKAKAFANELKDPQVVDTDYLPTMQENAVEIKADLIELENVSKKVQKPQFGPKNQLLGFDYEDFKIAKDLIPYPRESASAEILSLFDLKKGIPYWNGSLKAENQPPGNDKAVDEFNEKLYRKNEKRQIQILTNKPRTVYYVTAVNQVHKLNRKEFMTSYAWAKGMAEANDRFISLIRSEAAVEFREDLIEQLRRQYLVIKDRSKFE